MVNIKVKEVLPVAEVLAFDAICKYIEYDTWWKIPVKTSNRSLNRIEFKPLFFIVIGVEVVVRESNQEVCFNYVKGPFRGHGIWKFKNLGNRNTEVSYEIFLLPRNFFFDFVSHTMLFSAKHIRDVRGILKGIQEFQNS